MAGQEMDRTPNKEVREKVTTVLDVITDKIDVKLNESDRASVFAVWLTEAGRLPAYALDHNRDGRKADDIAVSLIRILWQQGKYDPARHFRVVSGKGNAVAVLPSKAIDPGRKSLWKPIEPPEQKVRE